MIVINGTTQSLQAVQSNATVTTNPVFSISYVDVNLTALVQANTNQGSLNGTTAATILTGTTDQLNIKTIAIFNSDTVQQTITVQKNVSSTLYNLVKYSLNPGDSLHYDEGRGWNVLAFNSPASIVGATFVTSGTTYTTPANITATTQFKFTLIGAGGGGGGINTAADAATGGGGGAACIIYLSGLTASTAYTIAIGAGGTAGTGTPTAGSAGGATTLTVGATTYTAGGGGGGAAALTPGGSAGTSTNGTVNITGMQGNYGGATTTAAGGGGHSGLHFGSGGSGLQAAGTGNAATGFGGGGGGGRGAAATGGAGSGGCILVEYEN